MKQASLKLYRTVQSVSITNNNIETGKIILRALLVTIGLLALSYLYIISVTVWNIVERKSLEKEVQTLATDVGNLELEYLALSGSLNLEMSQTLGFREAKASFATRRSLGSLGYKSNEI